MELITTTALFLASMNVYNNDCNFAYNTTFYDDVVASQTVYKKSDDGKYLSKHFKYNYTYDTEQRLVKKEVMKWDVWANKWVNSHCLNYNYDSHGYSIEYTRWNAKNSNYTDVTEKQTYDETVNGAMAICSYSWDNKESQWILKDNVIMLNTTPESLFSYELE